MATTAEPHLALGDVAARQLANAQKTAPTMLSISPRWLVHLLPWVGVEAGIYRLNKVRDESRVLTACSQREDQRELPETFVDYDEAPREYYLSSVTTVVDVHTRISDLYSHPLRPDQGAATARDRDDQGAPGVRAAAQPRLRDPEQHRRRAEDQDARRSADAR